MCGVNACAVVGSDCQAAVLGSASQLVCRQWCFVVCSVLTSLVRCCTPQLVVGAGPQRWRKRAHSSALLWCRRARRWCFTRRVRWAAPTRAMAAVAATSSRCCAALRRRRCPRRARRRRRRLCLRRSPSRWWRLRALLSTLWPCLPPGRPLWAPLLECRLGLPHALPMSAPVTSAAPSALLTLTLQTGAICQLALLSRSKWLRVCRWNQSTAKCKNCEQLPAPRVVHCTAVHAPAVSHSLWFAGDGCCYVRAVNACAVVGSDCQAAVLGSASQLVCRQWCFVVCSVLTSLVRCCTPQLVVGAGPQRWRTAERIRQRCFGAGGLVAGA